jgi:hypothetical protein
MIRRMVSLHMNLPVKVAPLLKALFICMAKLNPNKKENMVKNFPKVRI